MSRYYASDTRRTKRITQAGYGASSNRTTLGYWVPLALTVTAATIGLAAWIWSERKEEEEDSSADEQQYQGRKPGQGQASMSGALPPGGGTYESSQGPFQGGPSQPEWGGGPGGASRSVGGQSTGVQQTTTTTTTTTAEDTSLVARMSSALGMGRSSSPGKAYDWASRNITAGVGAVAATVGGALGYSEGNKEHYEDHQRWSEEADSERRLTRQGTAQEFYSGSVDVPRAASVGGKKRKTVVIVVSSVEQTKDSDDDVGNHASILAQLPEFVDRSTTRVFVLIYAPTLTAHPLNPAATSNNTKDSSNGSAPTRGMSQSRTSSFSNIMTDEARTPGEFPGGEDSASGILTTMEPQPIDETTTSLYKTLHNQAMALVDRDTMIIPFTSSQGHKHIIKSLQPEIVYMQESMCGNEGEIVAELTGWVRTTVVVIGDEGGLGGLVDTDTEDERAGRKGSSMSSTQHRDGEKWWKREERTGVGRGVGVVEALRIGEDWKRRVGGEA